MEMGSDFYNTYIYYLFADNEFFPIGGGKGSPEFEEKLDEIKKVLQSKEYKVTRNDLEVRKDTLVIWNCPEEDKLKEFVEAMFDLMKKMDRTISDSLTIMFPPTSKALEFEDTINRIWEVKKDITLRENTDADIKDSILSYYGDGQSKISGKDSSPRAIVNLVQVLDTHSLKTLKIQGAKFINAISDIVVQENIQKVEKIRTDTLKCGVMGFCGKYSEDEITESEILVKNFLSEGSVESSFVSFGSNKSSEVLKAQHELDIKKEQAITYFNDRSNLVRRQIITGAKFKLSLEDKKWIKYMYEMAQKDFKKSTGKNSVLDFLVDLLTQQHNDLYTGPVSTVNGKKFRKKQGVDSLKKDRENVLRAMEELKMENQKREEAIALYKEKIRKQYWDNKLYLEKPFGEFWLEQIKSVFGEGENLREKIRELFEKLIGITTTIAIFDNCPDYQSFLTIYKSFSIIHKEMMKRLIEFVTKNAEYVSFLAGDTSKSRHPDFVANSLNNSVVKLDYNDFVFIKGKVSQTKIFGGTNNRIVVLGDINNCSFKCDDISIKGTIDAVSEILTKGLTAEKCMKGMRVLTGPRSVILVDGKEYKGEFIFSQDASNIILNNIQGRQNAYEMDFSY